MQEQASVEEFLTMKKRLQVVSSEHATEVQQLMLAEHLMQDRQTEFFASLARCESRLVAEEASKEHQRSIFNLEHTELERTKQAALSELEQLRRRSTDRGRHHATLTTRLREELAAALKESEESARIANERQQVAEVLRLENEDFRQRLHAFAGRAEASADHVDAREEEARLEAAERLLKTNQTASWSQFFGACRTMLPERHCGRACGSFFPEARSTRGQSSGRRSPHSDSIVDGQER